MNQILSTSMPINNKKNKIKYKNNKPVDIKNILKFFAISILIFGTLVAGTGVYAIYKSQIEKKDENLEPTISIENKTETSILLKVTHSKNIEKVEYNWNNEDKIVVNGKGGQYLEEEIELPAGTNTLHVLVQDEEGKEIKYEKQYELESNINFEVSENKIKITYNGQKQISYMTYKWDEEEEKTIEINDTKIEQELEALKGLHTLTVSVIDENNKKDTKSQKINGVSKPQVTIDLDEETREHFVIYASDDNKITKIEIRLDQDDNKRYELNLEDKDLKELQYTLPIDLQTGENFIEVKVYNDKNISNESVARYTKQ